MVPIDYRASPSFLARVSQIVKAKLWLIGQDVPLGNLSDLLPRKRKAHLMLTVTLPQSAPNSLQGQSSALTYTFTAVGAGP